MRTARVGEYRLGVRAEANRHRMQASTADLQFTLRAGLAAAAVEVVLVAYALLGGGVGIG